MHRARLDAPRISADVTAQMTLTERSYSRLIAWLKVILPLTALVILSTLFLLARTPDIEQAIPYADVDIDALAREPRISEPDFSGVAPDGTAVSMTARSARPDTDDPARFLADGLQGQIDTPDGERIRMSAVAGSVDTGAGLATLSGDVLVETSTGYAIRTETLLARLDSSRSESAGPVDIMAPFGHLTAGGFTLTSDGAEHLLVFSGGVDLIYDPRN